MGGKFAVICIYLSVQGISGESEIRCGSGTVGATAGGWDDNSDQQKKSEDGTGSIP